MMFRIFYICILLTITSIPAYANDLPESLQTLCQQMKYKQYRQNSADYVAGIDVNGNSVASADLNSTGTSVINNPISIPIELDIAERYGLILPVGIELKPTLGQIEIYSNGKTTLNGRDITDQFKDICTENAEDVQPKNKEGHGQEKHIQLPSTDTINGKIEGQYPEIIRKKPKYNN